MATITILRSKLSRAKQEDGDYVHPDLKSKSEEFLRLLNGNHLRPVVEHYCYEDTRRGSPIRASRL
eukprot:5680414-Pyramimonas_sp.AAC.1